MISTDLQAWWVECSPALETAAQQHSQPCSTAASRQQAYWNDLCLHACLAELRAADIEAHPGDTPAAAAPLWEVVNGSVITVAGKRLVLIPSEAIDLSELVVPQEWVDLPSWVGDYYLAVQVQAEPGWIRVWGYTTQAQLKTSGTYDPSDRTYNLAASQLKLDLNALWLTLELCASLPTRVAVAALPALDPVQAANLMQRLGTPAVMFPRLAIPFSLWGALIESDTGRHQLWQHRNGHPSSDRMTRLSDWLQGNFTAVWQAIETLAQPAPTIRWRRSTQSRAHVIRRAQLIPLTTATGTATVALVISVVTAPDDQVLIGIQVWGGETAADWPDTLQVQLLNMAGAVLDQAPVLERETASDTRYLEIEGVTGEQFQIVLTTDRDRSVHPFVI